MPSMKLTLANRALVLAGARPVSTLIGVGAEKEAIAVLYDMVRDDLFSRYPYRFAAKLEQLQRLADEPGARWTAAYALPAQSADGEVRAVLINDQPIDFDRVGPHVLCDAGVADLVFAELRFLPQEAAWPAYFCSVFALELASHLAITLAEDTAKANLLSQKAIAAFRQSKGYDAQMRTARKLPVGGLRRWHRGRP